MIQQANFGSPPDLIIIFVLALLVFGPKKLPEFGRQIGMALKEFRKVSDEFTGAVSSVKDEVDSVYKPLILPHDSHSGALYSSTDHPMTPVIADPDKPKRGLTLSTLPQEAIAPVSHDPVTSSHELSADKAEGI